MRDHWLDKPILRAVLPHTGRLDGDDTGYRDVGVHPGDAIDPDPLVVLPDSILRIPVYCLGRVNKITPLYEEGLGASPRILVRVPVARALLEADALLAPFNRALLVLDGFRPAHVQARLWAWLFKRSVTLAGLDIDQLTLDDWIVHGRAADNVGSYCSCIEDEEFNEHVARLVSSDYSGLARVGSPIETAKELVTFQINYGLLAGRLDAHANTAHGSGGAVDVVLAERSSGEPVMMGVHFDSISAAAVMDWFERNGAAAMRKLIIEDPDLSVHYRDFGIGIEKIDGKFIEAVRRERRLLFHAMMAVGASFFSLGVNTGESWHFNLGNERGGLQSADLYGAGNACHSLLRHIIDPVNGKVVAVWGNAAAHELAWRLDSAD